MSGWIAVWAQTAEQFHKKSLHILQVIPRNIHLKKGDGCWILFTFILTCLRLSFQCQDPNSQSVIGLMQWFPECGSGNTDIGDVKYLPFIKTIYQSIFLEILNTAVIGFTTCSMSPPSLNSFISYFSYTIITIEAKLLKNLP